MSYILEALKKSDKDRKREVVPDLSSDHSFSSLRREERKIHFWQRPIVLILLCLTVSALFWLLFSDRQQVKIVAEVDPVVALTPRSVPEKPVVQTPEFKQQINKEVTEVTEVTEVMSEIVAVPEPEKPEEPVVAPVIPLLEELPPDLKATIPQLSFAGPVYADEGKRRMIMINMRVVREGNMVSPGLVLQEIEENGVVLRYQEITFRVRLF